MQGKFDTARLSELKISEPLIRKGDLISIIVYSDNPQATAIYNQSLITVNSGTSTSGGGNSNSGGGTGSTTGSISAASPSSPGYLVDESGSIQFQGLGNIHVEGLTKKELKDLLDSMLKKYLTNPYYTIRFLNYRFTMLGEINKPGIFSIPGEHISLLEAMGLAGDLTFFGRRDNVLVIRENNGKREWARLDLTNPDVMSSPYFYLQQNDVVYVEANRKKVVANDQVTVRNISIAATVASTLAILYSIFRK
ncbi:MAG TPA: polysaccharide biosynthesis/export family protein [Puia sp.]|jgi:polysaccharide export outer membrane protein